MRAASIMTWLGTGCQREMEIKFISRRMNNKMYVELVDQRINTYAARTAGNKFVFPHDNAAVRTAKILKDYFVKIKFVFRIGQ